MYDVVVIGAGLSGLQAALSAQEKGLSVVVLEARNRVGGKVWSVPLASGRGSADLGAAWVNDSLQKRVWAYARRFNLEVVKQRLEGRAVLQTSKDERLVFPFGITPEFSPEEKKDLEHVRDHIQAASKRAEPPLAQVDNVSLDQYVRDLGAGPKTIQMVNLWAKVMHGMESTEESAAFFVDYCRRNKGLLAIRADDHTGGQYLRFHTGAQSIAEGLVGLVGPSNIHLSSPVASIQDSETHVRVTTTTGNTFVGRKCIVSVPSTMYRDLNIYPVLPPALQEVANATRLGHYNKAIVCYDRPWWRDLGYNGLFMCYEGCITLGRDTSVDEQRLYCLTCFINGYAGREWSKLPPHERRRAVLEQLATVFDRDKDSELYRPIEVFDQIWQHEQYSKGALVPVTAIGHLTKFADVYGKPVGNLHFVGTEYALEWKGYMEGALDSGEQGATEVAEAIEKGSTPRL